MDSAGCKGGCRRRYAIIALLLALANAAFAQGDPRADAADHTTYVVTLPGATRDTMAAVEAAGGVIDHYDGREVRAYIHVSHWQAFLATGIPYAIAGMQPLDQKQLASYPDYDDITTIVNSAAANYPDIVRLESLGASVQGREIWALRITDQPDEEEDEPEFAYISTIHGDERIGTILCLNFLDLLLSSYGSDAVITNHIDEAVIWLVPLLNPDGYELGVRWNANNYDLNRSFPEYTGDFSGTIYADGIPSTNGRQPEVAHIMDWTAAHSFTLCANYHSGALVVNYPYDLIPGVPSGSEAICPDDGLMKYISTAYAELNPPMHNNFAFPGGITNGSAWYSITGGMQDWHYRYTGMIDLTIELSNTKIPATGSLPGLWEDNREAMLAFLALAHRGARGIVTDRITGGPLYAQVLVDDNPQPVFTDPDVGDFHRLLLPGTYTLRVESPGYIPYAVIGLDVDDGPAVRADVPLSKGDVNRDGEVNSADLQLVINAVLELNTLEDADVDGNGVGATDVQHLVNRLLHR